MGDPTQEEWQALYDVALEFRRQAPWQWLANDDLFAVEHPVTAEVGYCSVMGAGGEEFGLSMFIGADGFESYRGLMSEEVDPESLEASARSRFVAVTFVDREFMERRDLAVIRSLGLRFRGRGAWPWFRSQLPGYLPWYLEQDEAVFLRDGLAQAMEVARRVQAGSVVLPSGAADGPVLTRRYRDGAWIDEWREPPHEAARTEHAPLDELRLQRLRQGKARGADVWLLDLFLLPAGVGAAGERPYYPRALLVMDEQGFILDTQLFHPSAPANELHEALLTVIEHSPQLPREIVVASEDARRLVEPVGVGLGLSTRLEEVPMLETVRDSLRAHMGG